MVSEGQDRTGQVWKGQVGSGQVGKFYVRTVQIGTTEVGTVDYFESTWNLENLVLECGPAQPDLYSIFLGTIFSKIMPFSFDCTNSFFEG